MANGAGLLEKPTAQGVEEIPGATIPTDPASGMSYYSNGAAGTAPYTADNLDDARRHLASDDAPVPGAVIPSSRPSARAPERTDAPAPREGEESGEGEERSLGQNAGQPVVKQKVIDRAKDALTSGGLRVVLDGLSANITSLFNDPRFENDRKVAAELIQMDKTLAHIRGDFVGARSNPMKLSNQAYQDLYSVIAFLERNERQPGLVQALWQQFPPDYIPNATVQWEPNAQAKLRESSVKLARELSANLRSSGPNLANAIQVVDRFNPRHYSHDAYGQFGWIQDPEGLRNTVFSAITLIAAASGAEVD